MPLFYKLAIILLAYTLQSQIAFAKWEEERDLTTNGKEELVYYYKTNDQGQKLVLDKYKKRLIFIRKDRLLKRRIYQMRIDGFPVDVMSDPFSHYPEQTAITFDNQDEILKKLFFANEIQLDVRYGREQAVSTFQIR
jgi:hypothetical protein